MTTYFLGVYVMARRDDVEERDGGGWLVGWSCSDAGLISPWSWWMMVGSVVDVSSVVSSSSLPCSSGPLLSITMLVLLSCLMWGPSLLAGWLVGSVQVKDDNLGYAFTSTTAGCGRGLS